MPAGSLLPSRKEIAQTYGIAVGTAHRAVVVLGEWGLVRIRSGHRSVELDHTSPPAVEAAGEPELSIPDESSDASQADQMLVELVLRRKGAEVERLTAAVTTLSAGVLRQLLSDAIRRAGGNAPIGDFEMDVRHVGAPELLMTFVAPA